MTRSSSKRTAEDAKLPNTDAAKNTAAMADDSTAPAAAASSSSSTDAPSTSQQLKKQALDVGAKVQDSLAAGLASATETFNTVAAKTSVLAHQAKDAIEAKMAPTPTAALPPYNMSAADSSAVVKEPTFGEKASAALHQAGDALKGAAKSVQAGMESVSHKAVDGVASLKSTEGQTQMKQDFKDATAGIAAGIQATVAQVSAAFAGATGSEVAKPDLAKDGQISDASHAEEKPEGSLPVERNADEFPHAKAKIVGGHETAADSQLKATTTTDSSFSDVSLDKEPGAATKTDLPLGSTKADSSSTASKTDNNAQIDLLTGPNQAQTA